MKNRFGVKVMPREVILDSEGRAVEQSLRLMGLSALRVRVGKFIELEIEGEPSKALEKAHQITNNLLHNPLIEEFQIQPLEAL